MHEENGHGSSPVVSASVPKVKHTEEEDEEEDPTTSGTQQSRNWPESETCFPG